MAITTMDGLVSALGSTGQQAFLNYPSGTTVAGGLTSLNQLVTGAQGIIPAPGTASTGGTIPTTATAGSIPFTYSASTYLAKLGLTFATIGTVTIFDRVWAGSGFSGTVTTAQSTGSFPTLTRPGSTGVGLLIFLESWTAVGATGASITCSYTNSAGSSGRTTVSTAMIASFPVGRVLNLPLQSGDTGVQSIQSVTLSGTTGTAGNFGIALYLPIGTILSCGLANTAVVQDFAGTGFPSISNNASLIFVHQGSTTSTGAIIGSATFVTG